MMPNRYELQVGKWGMYVHDKTEKTDINMEEVCNLLNFHDQRPKPETVDSTCPACGEEFYRADLATPPKSQGVEVAEAASVMRKVLDKPPHGLGSETEKRLRILINAAEGMEYWKMQYELCEEENTKLRDENNFVLAHTGEGRGDFMCEPPERIYVWQRGDDEPLNGMWIDTQDPMNMGVPYVREATRQHPTPAQAQGESVTVDELAADIYDHATRSFDPVASARECAEILSEKYTIIKRTE